jgi:spore germination protein GerM
MQRRYVLAAIIVVLVWLCVPGCRPAVTDDGKVAVEVFFVRSTAADIEVVSVERSVPAEADLARAAIQELLKGPTAEEGQQGLKTTLNEGVALLSLTVDPFGVAYADFDARLQEGVGGSARVGAIRQQIEQTLMHITGITSVILSVEGRTEDILQP